MDSDDGTVYQEDWDDGEAEGTVIDQDTGEENTSDLAAEAAAPEPVSASVPRVVSKPAPPSARPVSKPSNVATPARPVQPRLRKPASRHTDKLETVQEQSPVQQPKRPNVQVIPGKKNSLLAIAGPAVTLVVGTIMIAIVVLAIYFPSGFSPKPVKKMPSMFYELTDSVWPKKCTPVTVEEIQAGKVTILSKEVKLADIRDSLIHHMEEKGEDGLCAQNLEKKPICYCVLATNSTSQPYLEMYNMIRMGDSFPYMEEVPEEHIFCKHPVVKMRYNHVTVRFLMPNGVPDRQRFEAPESYAIQAFDDMLRGVSRCEDNKEQLMMHDIHDGVRYLSREQMYKEYGHMLRAYPEGLLPDAQVEERRGKRIVPSLSDK